MIEINKDVIFVQGYINGAIYDLNTERVYSVNKTGCDIIRSYVENQRAYNDNKYCIQLRENRLISEDFAPREYLLNNDKNKMNLEMAWLEITQACNMKCVHCYEGEVHKSSAETLNLCQWKDVVDQLARQKINRLIIIGGEPCVHRNILDIIEYASKYDFKIVLFTNASLIDECLFDCIVTHKINVKVSVYGGNATVHEKVTKSPGSFEKLKNTVERLVQRGISVEAAVILMRENQDDLENILALINALGMKYSRYDVIRQVYGGTQNEHIPTNNKLIDKVSLTKPNFRITKEQFGESQRNTCWYGKIVVTENGNVFPCEFERNIVYGNVKESTIEDILNGKLAKDMWHMDFSQIEHCQGCEYRYACKDCRPLGISVCGNIHTKNPRCCYEPLKGKWIKRDWQLPIKLQEL